MPKGRKLADWISNLTPEDLQKLKKLAGEGFGVIEINAHGNFRGDLPDFHVPGKVEQDMKDMGLNTDGINIQRERNSPYYPNDIGPRQRRRREGE